MISQPTDPTTYKPQPLWSRRTLIIAITLIVLLIGWLLGETILRQINSFATDTWHCFTTECNPTGPAASWQEQFSAAESVARKIDPDAVLTGISARPAAYTYKAWQSNDSLEISFQYVLTDGGSLVVRLWDSKPSNVWAQQYGEDWLKNASYYREFAKHKTEIGTILAQINVSPRQAIDATLAEAKEMEQIKDYGVRPTVNLYFDFGPLDPRKWRTTYSPYVGDNAIEIDWRLLPQFTVETSTGVVENTTKTNESPTP
jgi:hypothetical protein